MQNDNMHDIHFGTLPASADTEIDLASLGITTGSTNTYGALSCDQNISTVCCHAMTLPVKHKTAKVDAVSVADYCLLRLAEIRRINELSHTPSAYSCLMSFIGFLASLVYEKESETDAYTKFFHEYIKEMYCARVIKKDPTVQARLSGHPKNNSWGEVIYSLMRCGLVHNMNVAGKKNNQEQIRIALTHEPFYGKNCRVHKFGSYAKAKMVAENDESVILVINVFDLCDAVQKAIIRMFQKQKVRASAGRVVAHRPVIRQIS